MPINFTQICNSLSFFLSIQNNINLEFGKNQYNGDSRSAEINFLSYSITCFFLVMDDNVDHFDLSAKDVGTEAPMRVTKCGQGKKLNKCNQCEYASVRANNVKAHMNTHSGEKPYKCNQCDYSSSYARALRCHLKMHINSNNVTMHPHRQLI